MYEINPTQGPPAHQHQHQQRRPDQAADVKERGPPIWLTISRASLLFGEHDLPQTRSLAPRTHQLLSPRSPTGRSFVWPAVDVSAAYLPTYPTPPPASSSAAHRAAQSGISSLSSVRTNRWWRSMVATVLDRTHDLRDRGDDLVSCIPRRLPRVPRTQTRVRPQSGSAHGPLGGCTPFHRPICAARRAPGLSPPLVLQRAHPAQTGGPTRDDFIPSSPPEGGPGPLHTKDSTSCRAGCAAEHPWFCRVPYADASLWSARVVSLAVHAGANAASGPRSGATDTGRRRIPDAARCTIRRECSPLPAAQVCPSFLCALGPPRLANRPRKPAPLVECTPAARLCTTSISLHSSFPGSTLPSPANLHPDLHAALHSPPTPPPTHIPFPAARGR
ncbi:hypothetical protein AcW1_009310 [Taiwanofungus camphoratus]|nr:hypothetical protein AcW1_009310 [Antrodia cinnamomea]